MHSNEGHFGPWFALVHSDEQVPLLSNSDTNQGVFNHYCQPEAFIPKGKLKPDAKLVVRVRAKTLGDLGYMMFTS